MHEKQIIIYYIPIYLPKHNTKMLVEHFYLLVSTLNDER